jgi:hydrogenase maturation protease
MRLHYASRPDRDRFTHSSAGRYPVLVVGVGNEYRHDDGAGLVVARELRARAIPQAVVVDVRSESTNLIEIWQEVCAAVVVDAVRSDAPPGTVFRYDAINEPIPAKLFHNCTHTFSIAQTVELARALYRLPPNLIVFAIESKNFEMGVGLSPEVHRCVPSVVEQVVSEIARLARRRSTSFSPSSEA